eukprot:TRINITY_DN11954_c0_g1_i1.p1 TRINITY_DN11954_c0_g1~~TRINITY_DN11954_c0_g1_i1.p1  ORF type:complete len:417 (+),score=61.42 TRINITY_DN11954_c0_g1_i1:81-1253(+)
MALVQVETVPAWEAAECRRRDSPGSKSTTLEGTPRSEVSASSGNSAVDPPLLRLKTFDAFEAAISEDDASCQQWLCRNAKAFEDVENATECRQSFQPGLRRETTPFDVVDDVSNSIEESLCNKGKAGAFEGWQTDDEFEPQLCRENTYDDFEALMDAMELQPQLCQGKAQNRFDVPFVYGGGQHPMLPLMTQPAAAPAMMLPATQCGVASGNLVAVHFMTMCFPATYTVASSAPSTAPAVAENAANLSGTMDQRYNTSSAMPQEPTYWQSSREGFGDSDYEDDFNVPVAPAGAAAERPKPAGGEAGNMMPQLKLPKQVLRQPAGAAGRSRKSRPNGLQSLSQQPIIPDPRCALRRPRPFRTVQQHWHAAHIRLTEKFDPFCLQGNLRLRI